MKLNKKVREVESSVESKEFTIKASGKAFSLLIDGLYSDKIKSIIRELSTNAYDSHLEANREDKPFYIHLPNTLEPYFYVRDFGTSMDPETVLGLYSTVFDSSKDASNEAVGCFGLGSKSPFAYTDTFTVETYLDGVANIYAVMLNEEGIPSIGNMGRFETEEESGVKVSLPVNSADFTKFAEKAQEVFKGFDTKPIVTGQEINLTERPIYRTGDFYKIYEQTSYGTTSYVRQGCVLYPIDLVQLKDKLSPEIYEKFYETHWPSRVVIDVPIGSCDVATNRENLAYTQKTVETLTEYISKFINEMVTWAETKFEEHNTTKWNLGAFVGSLKGYDFETKWLKFIINTADMRTVGGKKMPHTKGYKSICFIEMYENKKSYRFSKPVDTVLYPAYNKCFIVELGDQDCKNASGRIRRIAHEHTKYTGAYWMRVENMRDAKKILRFFGYPPFFILNDVTPYKAVRENGDSENKVSIKQLTLHGEVDVTDDEFEDLDYYCYTNMGSLINPASGKSIVTRGNLKQFAQTLNELDIVNAGTTTIVLIPASRKKDFDITGKINIFEKIEKTFTSDFVKDSLFAEATGYSLSYKWNARDFQKIYVLSKYGDWLSEFNNINVMRRLHSFMHKNTKSQTWMTLSMFIDKYLQVNFDKEKEEVDKEVEALDKEIDGLVKRWPLFFECCPHSKLDNINETRYESVLKHLTKYIELEIKGEFK